MGIQEKINELDTKIYDLLDERSKIDEQIKELKQDKLSLVSDDVVRIVQTIESNPGLNRKQLGEIHPEIDDIKNVLTSARRNFSLIENRGTRAQPRWFAVDSSS